MYWQFEFIHFWKDALILECVYIPVIHLFILSTPRSFLLEDRCRFLSNFSQATADVGIPGEYLIPKVNYSSFPAGPYSLLFNVI